MSPKIKAWSDKIYASNPKRYSRLIVWIRQAQKHQYSTKAIAVALEEFYRYCDDSKITNWYPYLDAIIYKIEGKLNAEKHEADHQSAKQAEADFSRATFGGRGLREVARQDRDE